METTKENQTRPLRQWRRICLDLALVGFAYAMWLHYLWRYRGLIARLLE